MIKLLKRYVCLFAVSINPTVVFMIFSEAIKIERMSWVYMTFVLSRTDHTRTPKRVLGPEGP